jgi:hypothetical protein
MAFAGVSRSRIPRWWWAAAPLVAFVAAYSLRYVVLGERAYVPELAASFRARPALVLIHTLFGPIALVLGMINLLPAHQPPSRVRTHRVVGRVYLSACVLLGAAGLALSVHAAGQVTIRLAPGQDFHTIGSTAERLMREAAPEGADVDIKWDGAPPGLMRPDSPAVQLGLQAFEQVLGVKPLLVRSGGTLPIVPALADRGIPTILTGFGLPEGLKSSGRLLHTRRTHYRFASGG